MSELKQENFALNQYEREHNLTVCESKPPYLQLEITTRCNLRCVTCARTYAPVVGQDMDPALFHRIEQELFPTLLTMDLQGFGEPLLCRHFDRFFDAATDHGVRVGFITNGILLDEKKLEKFVKESSYVGVSIDGASDSTFSAVRPKADFQRMCRMLRFFGEIRKSHPDSKADLNIIFVAIRENIEDLPAVLDLAEEWGATKLIVLNFSLEGLPRAVHHQHLANHPELANRIFAEIRQKSASYRVEVNMPAPFEARVPDATGAPRAEEQERTKESKFPNICVDPWWKTYITVNGHVRPCCGTVEMMGDLARQPFSEVWNCKKYRVLRKRVNSPYPPWYCRECFLWYGVNAGNPYNIKQKESLRDKADVAGQKLARAARRSFRRILGPATSLKAKRLFRL